MMRNKWRLLFLTVLLLPWYHALPQHSDELTIEWIYSQESRKVTALPAITWLNDGAMIIYDSSKPDSERTFEKLNPTTGKRVSILNRTKALESAREVLGEKNALRSISMPLAFDARGENAVYLLNGDVFILNLKTALFSQVTNTDAEEKCINFAPDGKKLAYVRDNDLYVYDLQYGIETRLTTDGSDAILNGTLSWVYWEEVFGRQDIG